MELLLKTSLLFASSKAPRAIIGIGKLHISKKASGYLVHIYCIKKGFYIYISFSVIIITITIIIILIIVIINSFV